MSYKINTEKKKKYGFKNLALASLCLIIFQQNTFSQGWIGNVNNIYPVNSSLQLTPLNVGIGTNLATAQLHTTGSVRFAGITANNTYNNILVQDANGNLFYRDASTITSAASNEWHLTGNTGTNPAINFLGTTDNQRLVFRASNLEAATILANGNFGIGIINPQAKLEVNNLTPDNHLKITGTAPSIQFTQGTGDVTQVGRIGFATVVNNFTQGSKPGDFILQSLGAGSSFIFGTGGGGTANGIERVRINQTGYLGIATNAPTAALHVNCTGAVLTGASNIRFENLQQGGGNYLVIDALGYVRRSSASVAGKMVATTDNFEEINQLKIEINSLKEQLSLIQKMLNSQKALPDNIKINEQKMFTVYPNPTDNLIKIESINPNIKAAVKKVILSDINGKAISSSLLQNSLTIPLRNLKSGTYLINIYDNNNLIQTERIILINK